MKPAKGHSLTGHAQKKISKFILPLENLEEVGQFRARNNTTEQFSHPWQ
jgi:hypothetical protein